MPINSAHEFSADEIAQIEAHGFTVADARKFLSDWSVNAEGSAEIEFDTLISGLVDLKKKGGEAPLESFLDNEVSDTEARPQEKLSGDVPTTE